MIGSTDMLARLGSQHSIVEPPNSFAPDFPTTLDFNPRGVNGAGFRN
jgi:hypothetical protein